MKASELKQTKSLSPLYKLERKLNLKSLIIFTIVGAVVTLLTTLMFLLVDDVLKVMQEMFENNPEMQEALGDALTNANLASYFVANAGSSWGLIGTLYAGYLGCKLVNSNLKDNSYETLYTLEFSRNKILLHKLVRLIINVVIFNLVVALFGFIGVCVIGLNQINVWNYLLYTLICIVVCLQVGIICFGLACLFKRKFKTILSIILCFALYLFADFSTMGANFKFLEYLTPVSSCYSPIITSGLTQLNYISFAVWLVVSGLVLTFGMLRFNKRDII